MKIFKPLKNTKTIKYNPSNEIKTTLNFSEFSYPIKYNTTNPSKIFNINCLEKEFFNYLYLKLTDKENAKINLIRMSNGELSAYYSSYPIGRIKLQGRKYYMQILYDLYKFEHIEGSIDEFIPKIDNWITYIRIHLKY